MEVNIAEAYTVNAFKNSLDRLCQPKNQDTCALSRLLKYWKGLFSVEFFCRISFRQLGIVHLVRTQNFPKK